jgi:ABC-type dipeptide/oligopeptide/nickel transport system permease component
LTVRALRSGLLILLVLTAVIAAVIWKSGNRFDPALLDTTRIQKHVAELTSSEYAGRLTGSPGNEAAVAYVEREFSLLGLLPAVISEENGQLGYKQPFRVVVPDIEPDPLFRIADPAEDTSYRSFTMYEDYNLVPAMNGSGIEFQGDIIIAGTHLTRVDPGLLHDRVVVIEARSLNPERIGYVLEHGGLGVLCSADSTYFGRPNLYERVKTVHIGGTTHPALAVGYISRAAYRYLRGRTDEVLATIKGEEIGLVHGVEIQADIRYPLSETANVIGIAAGRSSSTRTLLISADLDGAGEGPNGRHFPGALNSASGTATLLEIARVVSEQAESGRLPYKQIIFAVWNGQLQQLSGTEYFLTHPTVPLERLSVIHLGAVGVETLAGLKIASDSIDSYLLKDTIMQYGVDAGLSVQVMGPLHGAVTRFNDRGIAGVTLTDEVYVESGYGDTADLVQAGALENAALAVLYYLKRAVYRDTRIDYLGAAEWAVIGILAAGLLIIVLMEQLYRGNPGWRPLGGGASMEDIYFRFPSVALRRFYGVLGRIGIVAALLTVIANIDPGFNVKLVNGERVGNLSWYLVLKQSLLFLRGLFTLQLGSNTAVGGSGSLVSLIYKTSFRSLLLLGSAVIAAGVLGIAGGMLEGYWTRRRSLRSLGTLVIFSVPDVLIVLLGLLFYVVIAQRSPALKEMLPWKEFLLPLVTLAIIPTIYISRITFVTIQEELRKDYIRNARAKGIGRRRLFTSELLPAVLFKIVDSMPAIMTMLLSNLIIVEYLFNYLGLVYYLLYFYTRQETDKFIALAVTLGVIYLLFTWGIQAAARMINPLKRTVKGSQLRRERG